MSVAGLRPRDSDCCVYCLTILVVRGTLGMATGKVKWFNNAKGYGFILPEGGGADLFAHYSSIQMEGYKTLKAGQDVVFDVLAGPKGDHAVNIRTDDSLVADPQAGAALGPDGGAPEGGWNGERDWDGAPTEAPAGASVTHNGGSGVTS